MEKVICRLCSDDCKREGSIALFYNENGDTLVELINKYLNLKVTKNDVISTFVCINCSRLLEDFHMFFRLVSETQTILKKDPVDPLYIEDSCKETYSQKKFKDDECNDKYFTLKCKHCSIEFLSFEKLLSHLKVTHNFAKERNHIWGNRFLDIALKFKNGNFTEASTSITPSATCSRDNSFSTVHFLERGKDVPSPPDTVEKQQRLALIDLESKMMAQFSMMENNLQSQKKELEQIKFSLLRHQPMKRREKNWNPFDDRVYDFTEFENFKRLIDEDSLLRFEEKLKDENYMMNFLRYLESQYVLNGTRDSKAIFRTIFRRIVSPSAIMGYSWKGNKRNSEEIDQIVYNKSFITNFKNIVKFFDLLLESADSEYRREQLDQYFDKYLRSKKKELQREQENAKKGSAPRASTSRTRKRQRQENFIEMICEDQI